MKVTKIKSNLGNILVKNIKDSDDSIESEEEILDNNFISGKSNNNKHHILKSMFKQWMVYYFLVF